MSKMSVLCVGASVCLTASAILPVLSAEEALPNFNPDGETAWAADRPASDDYLPHDKSAGPGPVESDPAHPYIPNANGVQSTYRIADITNPILQDWVAAQIKEEQNDRDGAGGEEMPFIARERCYPGGVPTYDIYNRGQPVHIWQTKDQVIMVNELYASTRRIYLNVPHTAPTRNRPGTEEFGRPLRGR